MKIIIYTITDCQFSKQEKDYLTAHSLPFEEKNLETNHEYLTEMLNISNNFAGTPVTKIEKEDGTSIIMKGFTAEEFDKELGFQKTDEKPEQAASAEPALAAPPASPPEPVPQPPSPIPQPSTPTAPPTIPNQSAQPAAIPPQPPVTDSLSALSNQSPSQVTQAPGVPETSPAAETIESTVDDSSLDAILSQLQQKTGTTETADQSKPQTPPPPAPGTPPTIPDFGSNS